MIDFSQVLKTLDGKTLEEGGGPVSLRAVCVNALLVPTDDQQVTGEEKVKRFHLAQTIHAADEPLKLMSEDVAKVKNLVGRYFPPLIVGQAWDMLENSAN